MAVHLEFEKVSETPATVEYLFGGVTDPRAHRLSIVKDDPSATDLPEGISQALSAKVIGRAASRARAEGAWPDRGLIQS